MGTLFWTLCLNFGVWFWAVGDPLMGKSKNVNEMVARFAKADSQVAASKSTLSFLQSQIDIWNSQGD